jgi:hypothetical protein
MYLDTTPLPFYRRFAFYVARSARSIQLFSFQLSAFLFDPLTSQPLNHAALRQSTKWAHHGCTSGSVTSQLLAAPGETD